jgi:DNA-binding PadR family transcriptional regulator
MKDPLTDNEGTLLSLLIRAQPVTAYQISKIYEESPVSNFNTSKGKIYPLIKRLIERGMIKSVRQTDKKKKVDDLYATALGRDAVRAWIKQCRDSHLLLEDPLRTKVQAFDLLTREERIEWVVDMKERLKDKLATIEEYGEEVDVPFKELVHSSAVQSVLYRLEWLDQIMAHVVRTRE